MHFILNKLRWKYFYEDNNEEFSLWPIFFALEFTFANNSSKFQILFLKK